MIRIRLNMPRRLVITKAGSPSVLDVIEMPMPEPQAGAWILPTKATIPIHPWLRSEWNYPFTW